MPTVTCFGEVLWDLFPTHRTIGGAPLNVALRLNSFGVDTHIISRIGNDENGEELSNYAQKNGLDISNIQIDPMHKTGCVKVYLDERGSASYEIEAPVAWDRIKLTSETLKTVKSSDAFVFGSLVCRDEVSRMTLLKLLSHAEFKIFDVNLRPPFYSMELVLDLMKKADFIKCNDEELYEICSFLGTKAKDIETLVKFLSGTTETSHICVTKGKEGALLFYNKEFYNNEGYPIKVVDTVGAGDSFLAALVSKLISKTDAVSALDFACAVGALVASKKGANPNLENKDILAFIRNRVK